MIFLEVCSIKPLGHIERKNDKEENMLCVDQRHNDHINMQFCFFFFFASSIHIFEFDFFSFCWVQLTQNTSIIVEF